MPLDAPTAPNEFAGWLRQAMRERSLSGVTLARLVNEQLPGGHFAASNISHYLSGRSRPRPAIQQAIEHALAGGSTNHAGGSSRPRSVSCSAQPWYLCRLRISETVGRAWSSTDACLGPMSLKVLELLNLNDSAG